ncbi:MAG: phosphatase PAP2 family protein [Deltaproteobacteria bacterium]|nr:phosphatase PAP2 family protein [Deltaproteobacteria bacterium]MBW2179928.1 phosphatase PAP2 family protein [Deltaproteobacteria bacterium]
MENFLDWGIQVVLWFQHFSPTMDVPFKVLTFMGDETFFLLFLPLIYWCVDRRTGARMIILFLFSVYVNAFAKLVAKQPRPFEYNSQVQKIVEAGGGGFPSGHTQGAVVVWGYLASVFKKTWLWIVAGILMILIPMSRVYLGAHFPTDLLGGYIIGALLLILYIKYAPRLEDWITKKGFVFQLGCAVILPLILIIIIPGSDKLGITAAATLMGMSAGFALERKFVGFEASGVWWQRSVRYLIGIVVLIGLRVVLSLAFKDLNPEPVFRTIRYGLLGLWGTFGAPWIFVKIKLAPKGSAK